MARVRTAEDMQTSVVSSVAVLRSQPGAGNHPKESRWQPQDSRSSSS